MIHVMGVSSTYTPSQPCSYHPGALGPITTISINTCSLVLFFFADRDIAFFQALPHTLAQM